MIPSKSQDVRYFRQLDHVLKNFTTYASPSFVIAWSNSVCQAEQVGEIDFRFNFPNTLLRISKNRGGRPLSENINDSWRSKTLKLFLYWSGWHFIDALWISYTTRRSRNCRNLPCLVKYLPSGPRRNFLMRLLPRWNRLSDVWILGSRRPCFRLILTC